eukprot:8094415-Pyramimonas_sp.AAC.1
MQKKYLTGDLQAKKCYEEENCKFSMKSALGQRLQRELATNKKLKAEYNETNDVVAWKAKWVKTQYDGAVKRLGATTTQ